MAWLLFVANGVIALYSETTENKGKKGPHNKRFKRLIISFPIQTYLIAFNSITNRIMTILIYNFQCFFRK